MHNEGEEVHMDETEASGGSKENVVRWVLIIGTFLAIVFLSIIWITGALVQDDSEDVTPSSEIGSQASDEGSSTDSIVSDRFDSDDQAAPSGDASPEPQPTTGN